MQSATALRPCFSGMYFALLRRQKYTMKVLSVILLLIELLLFQSESRGQLPDKSDKNAKFFYFTQGKVSAVEYYNRDQDTGYVQAWNKSGVSIFRYSTSHRHGSQSADMSFHPDGSLAKVETYSAPDAGIQWYRGWYVFDTDGNLAEKGQQSWDDMVTIRVPDEYKQPLNEPVVKPEPFTTSVYFVNKGRKKLWLRIGTGGKDSLYVVAAGDTAKVPAFQDTYKFPDASFIGPVNFSTGKKKKPLPLSITDLPKREITNGRNKTVLMFLF